MEKVFEKNDKCAGCASCKNICPKGAITMVDDDEGFSYPQINQEVCIDCGMCKNVCPWIDTLEMDNCILDSYAAMHNDENIRKNSTSGGVFTALSDYVLKNAGSVYGAVYDENFRVSHSRAVDNECRDKMRGAKYIQSDFSNVYSQIVADIQNNMLVLVSGTPCQIAGIKSYIRNRNVSSEKLILMDLICHGVSSKKVFEQYLKMFEEKYNENIDIVKFRDKKTGWQNHSFVIKFKNKKYINLSVMDKFNNLFFRDLVLRPSCYNCIFTNESRVGDITVGDYWNCYKYNAQLNDDLGISTLFANTQKGKDIVDKLYSSMNITKVPIEHQRQPQLKKPANKPEQRAIFWQDFNKKPSTAINKYGKNTLLTVIRKKYIVTILKKIGIYKWLQKKFG